MAFTRTSPVDFSLSEPLYASATVTAYQVDPVLGVALTTLAPLYDSVAAGNLLANPQTLDSAGKFAKPVYIDQPVIFVVTNLLGNVATHATGIVGTNLAADAAASAITSAAAALSYMGVTQRLANLVKSIFTRLAGLPLAPWTFPGYFKTTSATVAAIASLATLRTDVAGGAAAVIVDPVTGSLTTAETVNAQVGATYALVAGDRGKLVTRANAGAMADTIAQAGTVNLSAAWSTDVFVPPSSVGSVTLTPTTSTINGAATLVIAPGSWAHIVSDGANYQAEVGGIVTATAPTQQVRQSVMAGAVDANGQPATIVASGTALGVDLKATSSPLALNFAGGFGSTGAIDTIQQLSADALNYWAGLPVNETSFLAADFVAAGSNPTARQTLAPPQYGPVYDKTRQALLHMEQAGTPLDDYGNTWALAGAAATSATQAKFGTKSLSCSGAAADRLICAGTTAVPAGSWTMDGWLWETSLPAANTNHRIVEFTNAGGFGLLFMITNSAGTNRYRLDLSSNGTSLDIAAGVTGASTPTSGSWVHWAVVFDALAGKYLLYIGGVQEISIASSLRISGNLANGLALGMVTAAASNFSYLGFVDEFRLSPFARFPNGTTFTPPVAAGDATVQGQSSDWFDTINYKMNQVSAASGAAGVNPTFTAKNRLYIGEGDTGAAAVSAVRPYAIAGQYVGAWVVGLPVAATAISKNSNLGTELADAYVDTQNIVSELGFTAGDYAALTFNGASQPQATAWRTRNTVGFTTGASAPGWTVYHKTTGVEGNAPTAANWQYRLRAKRNF